MITWFAWFLDSFMSARGYYCIARCEMFFVIQHVHTLKIPWSTCRAKIVEIDLSLYIWSFQAPGCFMYVCTLLLCYVATTTVGTSLPRINVSGDHRKLTQHSRFPTWASRGNRIRIGCGFRQRQEEMSISLGGFWRQWEAKKGWEIRRICLYLTLGYP